MRRELSLRGAARPTERTARSIACLAFVAALALAFWAGAAWIVQAFVRLNS
jgi:hypothetical protein